MPRGKSELTPLDRVIAGDPIGEHTRSTRQVPPSGWESDNIQKIVSTAEMGDELRRGDRHEIPTWDQWWESLSALERRFLMIDEFGSRTYSDFHLKAHWAGEFFCRVAGLTPRAAEQALWLRAMTALAILSANGSRCREIRDHGRPGEPQPIWADGEVRPDLGVADAATGKRSWARNDGKDPDRDRDDELPHLEFAGWTEWLALQVFDGAGLKPGNSMLVYQRGLRALATRYGVAGPWRLSEVDVALARRAMANDVAALREVASWLEGFGCKVEFVLERLADGTIRWWCRKLGAGSTSGLPFTELYSDGRQVFLCPNDGRRGNDHALGLTCTVEPGRATVTNEAGESVSCEISTSPVVWRLEGGPAGFRQTFPAAEEPPPPPPAPTPAPGAKKKGKGIPAWVWVALAAAAVAAALVLL